MHDGSTPYSPCPLAREPDGTPIPIPEGAAAWRVRRHTGGRPRLLLDAQKQPMKLLLAYSMADLEEILSPGTYRLDLVDHRGEGLGPTVQVSIGNLRNGNGEGEDDEEADAPPPLMASLPSTTSDTRYVLEANVRSMQLAFQHNQRTLELGLRMAETLREGVQVLSEAQAELMKSMASSRGFYRNAAPPVVVTAAPVSALPAAAKRRRQEDEDEDDADDEEDEAEDEDYEEPSPQNDWMESVKPLVVLAAQHIATTVMGIKAGSGESSNGDGLKLGEVLNWSKAAANGKAGRAAVLEAGDQEGDKSSSVAIPSAKEMLADPKVQMHLLSIMSALTPEEQTLAKAFAKELSEIDQARWFHNLKSLSVQDAVAKIRDVMRSATDAPAA